MVGPEHIFRIDACLHGLQPSMYVAAEETVRALAVR
jgi:hypothetical protein